MRNYDNSCHVMLYHIITIITSNTITITLMAMTMMTTKTSMTIVTMTMTMMSVMSTTTTLAMTMTNTITMTMHYAITIQIMSYALLSFSGSVAAYHYWTHHLSNLEHQYVQLIQELIQRPSLAVYYRPHPNLETNATATASDGVRE